MTLALAGMRFRKLLVIRRDGSIRRGGGSRTAWICKCDCGNTCRSVSDDLVQGNKKSCGCINDGLKFKNFRESNVWRMMFARCYDEKSISYPRYGAKGVRVCKRWHKFSNFLSDMGKRPLGLTLDRINNAKGYSPSNCRWASYKTQARNKKASRSVKYNGCLISYSELAEIIGMNRGTLYTRIAKRGWSVDRAVSFPICKNRRNKNAVNLSR